MSYARKSLRLSLSFVLLFVGALAPSAADHQVTAEFEITQLSVVDDIADATFKIVVKNDEDFALAGVFVVFDDGFEVAIGDVPAEGSGKSESTTRTFDLSQYVQSRTVPFPATLKYSAGGNAVEQAMNVVLRMDQ